MNHVDLEILVIFDDFGVLADVLDLKLNVFKTHFQFRAISQFIPRDNYIRFHMKNQITESKRCCRITRRHFR